MKRHRDGDGVHGPSLSDCLLPSLGFTAIRVVSVTSCRTIPRITSAPKKFHKGAFAPAGTYASKNDFVVASVLVVVLTTSRHSHKKVGRYCRKAFAHVQWV